MLSVIWLFPYLNCNIGTTEYQIPLTIEIYNQTGLLGLMVQQELQVIQGIQGIQEIQGDTGYTGHRLTA